MPFHAAVIALPTENIQDFIDLASGLKSEHKPTTLTEEVLVAKMAQHIWYSLRAVNKQAELFIDNPQPDSARMSLYMRYQSLHDRAFSKCLGELRAMRKEHRKNEIGFVSQKDRQELHAARVRSLNANAATRELEVEVRRTVEAPLPNSMQMSYDTLKSVVSNAITQAAEKLEAA